MKKYAPLFLFLVGLLQPIGYFTGFMPVRGIGIATVASPLPLVFSHFRGYETFAGEYEMELVYSSGNRIRVPITPALYGKLAGPYNRRNTYGAVISYGPALTEEKEKKLVNDVLSYGFCKSGPLALEFGSAEPLNQVIIYIKTHTQGRSSESWEIKVDCNA